MLVRLSIDAKRNHISCELFLPSHVSSFVGTKVSPEWQSYENMPRVRDSVGAGSALLALASVPSSS